MLRGLIGKDQSELACRDASLLPLLRQANQKEANKYVGSFAEGFRTRVRFSPPPLDYRERNYGHICLGGRSSMENKKGVRPSSMSGKSMNQVRNEEQSLGRLLSDIEELERTRAALLKRIESARSLLLDAGNRTGTIRASAELLWDHIADAAAAAEELALLEREIRDVEQDVDQFSREAAGLTFETESLKETLDEADEELERLSAILIERKTKTSKGH